MSVFESELRRTGLTSSAPVTIIEPHSRGWLSLNLGEIWTYHELLYFLIWRDVKVRYKQTAVGAIWVILQPLMTMVVFTLIFDRIAKISSDGLPYPLFAYAALLPWNLFAGALNRSGSSLVGQANLISKVYFPRLIVPLSATVSGLVDFAIAFVILIALMAWYGVAPNWAVLALPMFILLALAAAFSVGLWLSALNVKYRDVGFALPFMIQLWLFASPVAYSASAVPEQWQFLYRFNPMVGVIEGFRWALLGKAQPDFGVIALSATAVIALLFGGLVYFKRTEQTFVDVV